MYCRWFSCRLLLNEAEEIVYGDLTAHGPAMLDKLALRINLPPGLLSGTLMALEIRDIVSKTPNGIYELKS